MVKKKVKFDGEFDLKILSQCKLSVNCVNFNENTDKIKWDSFESLEWHRLSFVFLGFYLEANN